MKKLCGVSTDGAPSMIESNLIATARIMAELAERNIDISIFFIALFTSKVYTLNHLNLLML